MTSAPDPIAPRPFRLPFIDWARGLAVLIMIEAHVVDAWTRAADRSTTAYRYLTVLGGFAAPLFLWLAGLSLVLAAAAMEQRGAGRRETWRQLVQRGLEVFVLAFLFRTHSFFFNPGGAAITIFRVDILNIMGPAMVATALLWALSPSRRHQLSLYAVAAVATAMVTPVVRLAGWVDALPTWFQWYIRPAGEHTVFTLFPWAGFVFAGAASGVVLAGVRDRRNRHQVAVGFVAAGLALVALGDYTATLPTIYRQSSFWTSSPTFFAMRSGILLTAIGLLAMLEAGLEGRGVELRRLAQLGRASLLVYWIHVQLVYGWATLPLHKRLSLGQMLAAYVLFSIAMYGLIPLRNRLRAARTGTAEPPRMPEKPLRLAGMGRYNRRASRTGSPTRASADVNP